MSNVGDEKIQDYIDGRLSERDEAAMAAYLIAHPEKAAEIQKLRQQTEALKGLGAEVLSEPIPERLRNVIDNAKNKEIAAQHRVVHRRGLLEGLAIAATLVVGIVTGWLSHGLLRAPYPNASQLALQTARDAYLFYGTEKDFPVEFTAERENDLTSWFTKTFKMAVGRPNLDDVGYRYIGARVVPWSRGKMGLYLYENPEGARAALMFWPAENSSSRKPMLPNFEDLNASVYPVNGLDFALLCDKKNKDFDRISNAFLRYVKEPRS